MPPRPRPRSAARNRSWRPATNRTLKKMPAPGRRSRRTNPEDPDKGAWSVAKLWVGVDIGKAHHHVAAVDGEGRLVFSRKVDNDERDILTVIAEVAAVGRPVCW